MLYERICNASRPTGALEYRDLFQFEKSNIASLVSLAACFMAASPAA